LKIEGSNRGFFATTEISAIGDEPIVVYLFIAFVSVVTFSGESKTTIGSVIHKYLKALGKALFRPSITDVAPT
jgi:hypothetical protein